MAKKRRLRKSIRTFLKLSILVLIILFLYFILFDNLNFRFKKSLNENAYKYYNKHCLFFYPYSDMNDYAKDICNKEYSEDIIYDYKIIDLNTYKYIYYNAEVGVMYKDDKKVESLNYNLDLAKLLQDELRFKLKSDNKLNKDELINTYYQNLKVEDFSFEFKLDNLKIIYLPKDISFNLPYKYLQTFIGHDFGYLKEEYNKPRHIDYNKKLIALTFDDGPNLESSKKIIDILEYYDANATFFILGNRLGVKQLNLVKRGILNGNEYGSHSYSHQSLIKINNEEARKELLAPYNTLKTELDYTMRVFRPPYGSYNEDTKNLTSMQGILWNIDTLDWKSKDPLEIYKIVKDNIKANKVILMHDIYISSAEAVELIIPYLIDEGYEFVTISELSSYMQKEGLKRTFMLK